MNAPQGPLSRRIAARNEKRAHDYFHPGPQDCRDYEQCHGRAYGEPAKPVWLARVTAKELTLS